uniref:Lysozyme g n=1 Tax=Apteryx owenii TaxID=8824 RepID=A0A8B9QCL6_APTOW
MRCLQKQAPQLHLLARTHTRVSEKILMACVTHCSGLAFHCKYCFLDPSEYYGEIMKVDTTGASKETVAQEGLSYGVPASEKTAERDLKNMEKYQSKITKAGQSLCVDPAVIINKGGFGALIFLSDFQVDKQFHKIVGSWDSEEHITQGMKILCGMIKEIQKKFPKWTKEQQLKGGISAYNTGVKNVQSYDRMDIGTTKNDYANEVVARAQFYKRNGY